MTKPAVPAALHPAAEGLAALRQFTPARIALGRAGAGMPTAANLRFMLDHARARDAVHSALDFPVVAQALTARGWAAVITRSAAPDRTAYLRRPDLGRRLAAGERARLAASPPGCDVAVVVADGLSARALSVNLTPLLDALMPTLADLGLSVGPIVLVEQGRVAIGDEVGEALGAGLVVLLVGERPGLSAADSLGCYLTWPPKVGTMDSARHCVSNIRPSGLPVAAAAQTILGLINLARQFGATGLELDRRRRGSLPPPASSSAGQPNRAGQPAGLG